MSAFKRQTHCFNGVVAVTRIAEMSLLKEYLFAGGTVFAEVLMVNLQASTKKNDP
ncbi:hypothetical protein [Umezakia ovalisporum]|uniref:Uncharacterized protein n=2 Tax=Umezakia ovalisporum TaxID=75695 RepID=A0AA43KFP6_9CYAN|nr:hypothetical protein [Umezakia ovalisporum]MDH6057780.1 hypothetical protein [Umezakia ovalisporum FSS-43]MDH6064812.1 hypothetical protein [Umezakia ovalisporum FSS-62]MDH6067412.1 hypothetical protein [Umezakia ovalisporum APH033B]MDH6070367.1 hypothetical protein [Umezakia ovalisporum CobakiLakeA]MDH6074615.1 hypothetical protein [Umezakia ovalisporum CS-1034]